MSRHRTKEQAFTNLQTPKGSDAGREDLEKRHERLQEIDALASQKIFVPFSVNMAQRKAARQLREKGKNLVCGTPGQEPNFALLGCFLQLVEEDGEFVVRPTI